MIAFPYKALALVLTVLGLALIQGCAPVPVKEPSPPFERQAIDLIVQGFKEQQLGVGSFVCSGRVNFTAGDSDMEASILMAGIRKPFRVKMEITHFWGRPLLHMLVSGNELHMVSFPEKRYYRGPLGAAASLRFLPFRLDREQMWAFARGYPILSDHDRALSLKGDQITFLNKGPEPVQVIDLYPERDLPQRVSFPVEGIMVSYSEFETENGLRFARNTELKETEGKKTLSLHLKQVVFNGPVPNPVFEIQIPSSFERLPLHSIPQTD